MRHTKAWLASAALVAGAIVVVDEFAAGQPILPTVLTPASTGTGAGFNIAPGTAPSSPNNGDIWTTAAGAIVARLNGVSVNLANGGSGANSVSNSDGTLTISPTTGAVVASLALGHANVWTASQGFSASTTVTFPDSATWSSSGILGGTAAVYGATSAQSFNGVAAKLQLDGTTNATSTAGIGEWSNDGNVGFLRFLKSRGTSIGALGAVQSGDILGSIFGYGDDGATAGGIAASEITFAADQNFTSGNGYGRLSFWTGNGTGNFKEQLRIDHTGQIFVNGGATKIADQTGVLYAASVQAGGAPASGYLNLMKTANGAVNSVLQVQDASPANGDAIIGFFDATTTRGSISWNGTTAVQYNTTSDERLKRWQDVTQEDYSSVIRAIWVGDFDWKSGGAHDFGVRAQQLYPLYPYAVTKPKTESGIWQTDYGRLAPLALWGVQDIYRHIDQLNDRLRALQAQHEADERAVARLKHEVGVLASGSGVHAAN